MPAFVLDLDGTLYTGETVIPHAAEFVALLRRKGLPFLLVTNNSSRSPEDVASHLRSLGIEAQPQDVLTSAQAAAQHLQERGGVRRVLCVGEAGLRLALSEAGFGLLDDEAGLPDAVVQGIDRRFTYGKLEQAVRALRAGAAYVLTNPDRLLPSDGGLSPGAGSLAAAVEAASGVASRRRSLWAMPSPSWACPQAMCGWSATTPPPTSPGASAPAAARRSC